MNHHIQTNQCINHDIEDPHDTDRSKTPRKDILKGTEDNQISLVLQRVTMNDYDFEVSPVPSDVSSSSGSTLRINSTYFKTGLNSLEWQWNAGSTLKLNLRSKSFMASFSGGIKIWIYNSRKLSSECLSVCFQDTGGAQRSCFPISLDFVGWTAVWVAYREFIGCPPPLTSPDSSPPSSTKSFGWKIDQVIFEAPGGAALANPLHIDTLDFMTKISRETRDSIVPPLTDSAGTLCRNCVQISSGLTDADALDRYGRKTHWQQIYRWSLSNLTSPSPSSLSPNGSDKLKEINLITQRLINWYADESTTYTRMPHTAPTTIPEHRWDSLMDNVDKAHKMFENFKNGLQLNSGLFARNSKYGGSSGKRGNKKFSTLFYKVLLPLSLEYFLKSRPDEVNHVACAFASKYSCPATIPFLKDDIKAITGKNKILQKTFKDSYGKAPTSTTSKPRTCSATQSCFNKVKTAVDAVNENRKVKILELFDYVKDQGWNKGSALGSFDHEILGMSGFAHSVFLMRKELALATKLNEVIEDMKWYAQFGEIYQSPFEYSGSTADRIRTLMFFRLLTVFSMPHGTVLEQNKKIRDMDALKLWIENALTINKGLDGFIKPDFTCFHHRTFYASAYTPPALHTAALISYLLKNTKYYQLQSEISNNVANALKVLRIAAVRYSTPSAVGGRFPSYTRAVLAEHVPAYAYIAAVPPAAPSSSAPLGSITLSSDTRLVEMFLRLYDHIGICSPSADILNQRLCDGKVPRIYYLNTLGSLQIMTLVSSLASSPSSITAEDAPEGHWFKQFAALSIHRRGNWAVTVKGFDKFVWDFENSAIPAENLYGMYSSYGAMLIANNESALSTKDVDNGWDWRKIPGTTVINAAFPNMSTVADRYYGNSAETMAGGVKFRNSNGVFGMDFSQPSSYSGSGSYFSGVTFRFKKSVFFYNDLIVSLGSNIECSSRTDEVHTTLFQDKMVAGYVGRHGGADVYRCNDVTPTTKTSWPGTSLVTLVDVNGNRYYIPNPDDQGLVFWRNQTQTSVRSRGKNVTSSGTYCTSWFNHGVSPSGSKNNYEYLVQVDAERHSVLEKTLITKLTRIYRVIQKDNQAHVVEFPSSSTSGPVDGYVIFPTTSRVYLTSSTPLKSVLGQSIIMVEKKTGPDELYMSVTSPQLKLKKKPGTPSWCPARPKTPSKYEDVDETFLFCAESEGQTVSVDLRNPRMMLKELYVGDKFIATSSKSTYLREPGTDSIEFINLKNGFSTEVLYD